MMMTDPPKKFKYLSQTALCSTWLGVLGSEKKKENDGGGEEEREKPTSINLQKTHMVPTQDRTHPLHIFYLTPSYRRKK